MFSLQKADWSNNALTKSQTPYLRRSNNAGRNMESVERKDASSGPEEPIKSEDMVHNADATERASNASSPPPNCSICLGGLINTSYTDSCMHQFCFACLLQWSKIKTECPLCKQTFKSIIHNVRSNEDYDQYHVQQYASQVAAATPDVTADIHINGQWDISGQWENVLGIIQERPFMYRYFVKGLAVIAHEM